MDPYDIGIIVLFGTTYFLPNFAALLVIGYIFAKYNKDFVNLKLTNVLQTMKSISPSLIVKQCSNLLLNQQTHHHQTMPSIRVEEVTTPINPSSNKEFPSSTSYHPYSSSSSTTSTTSTYHRHYGYELQL